MTELVKRPRVVGVNDSRSSLNPKDILLLLLYLPGKTRKNNERIEGKLRFAKMVFLLKRETRIPAAVKEFYDDFAPRNFGPYSDNFDSDLKELKQKGMISEVKTEASAVLETTLTRTDYHLTEEGMAYCVNLIKQIDKETLDEIAEIKKKFNSMTVETLVNYVYWKYPDYAEASIIRDKVF